MALLTQYTSFFVSPFGEKSVTDELNTFLRSHRIINVEKRLIDGERGTGWVFLIEYSGDAGANKNAQGASQRIDYREVLNAEEYALFDKLRKLRKEAAEKSGIPVYAVFTNDQLAAMVKKMPKTAKDLLSISGIGEARVKQYGGIFLDIFLNEEQRHAFSGAPENTGESSQE
ncbi:MAG: HRDC domain-containing protein [Treponema sp.]|jgi:superfamily II DNA helicase RecQ|nr:HRDC domain-containing protein [Treponema sp.]